MLKTFRTLSSTIRTAQPTLYRNPNRNFSFSRLIEDMDFRKKSRYELMEANAKAKQQNKRFYQRIYDKAYSNRKKLAIFFGFCVILNLHPVYRGFLQVVRKLEPVKLQLKIWFLGEKNYIPDSIEETFMTGEGIRLSPHVHDTLSNLFLDTDRELKYGINKKFLRKLFAKVNCFKTKDDRLAFYSDSVYRKKLNQKLNGVSLKQFLLMYQDMYKKARKEEGISEEEFLKRIVDIWDETKLQTKVWEDEVMKKKNELGKNQTRRLVEERKDTIYRLIKDNAFISIEDLEARIIERGFLALSLREKVKALDYQLTRLSHLKSETGIDRFSGESGNLERVREIEEGISKVVKSLREAKVNFLKTFEKPSK